MNGRKIKKIPHCDIIHKSSFIYIIHHSLKAQERNLSTGLKRLSGKGERIIILGCGGRKGWVYYEVYKRTKKVVNSMEYKNDVSK